MGSANAKRGPAKRPPSIGRFGTIVAVTAVLGLGAATLITLALPRKTLLVISATGPDDQSLHGIKVLVNGQLRCESSPCAVSELEAGEHAVRVTSDEFGTAERVVALRTGADHSIVFVLARSRLVAAPAPSVASSAPSATNEKLPGQDAAGRANKVRSRNGTIRADSIPVAEVLVDGLSAGKSPANIEAAPGRHLVVFAHPDYGRRQIVVQVKANQEAAATVRFRAEAP